MSYKDSLEVELDHAIRNGKPDARIAAIKAELARVSGTKKVEEAVADAAPETAAARGGKKARA